MSVLFSRLANNESYISKPITETSEKHYEFNGTFFVDEYYIATNDEFDGYLLEGVRNAHIGLECRNASIVIESLGDVMHNIIQWFKKWLIKFKNFVTKCIKQLWNFFTSGEGIVKKIEGKYLDFKPFTIKGFRYTISPNDMNYQLYNEFINTVNAAAYEIAYATTEQSLNSCISKNRDIFGSPEFLNMFRGKMLKSSAVEGKDFRNEVKRACRNGMKDKEDLPINPSTVQEMCAKYKMFKDCIEYCKRNQKFMEENTELLIAWMESCGSRVVHDIPIDKRLDKEFRRKQISAIFNIYSSAALTAKQLQHVYDSFYMAKLDVINEAIVFYNRVLRQVFVEGKAKV